MAEEAEEEAVAEGAEEEPRQAQQQEEEPRQAQQQEEEMRNSSGQNHPPSMEIGKMSTDSSQTFRDTCP